MRSHFFSSAIMIFASMVYYGVQFVTGQKLAIDPQLCEIQIQVRSYFNPKEYVTICGECRDQYVLSYDLQTCTPFQDIGANSLQYCKRLGKDGTCIEAACTIQINENGDYVSVQYGNNDENCAQFNSQTGLCTFPRLGFELDLDTHIITENTDTYCAISQTRDGVRFCLVYHSIFIDSGEGYSVFPEQFIGSEYIDQSRSTLVQIVCIEGYELITTAEESALTNADGTTAISRTITIRKFYGCVIIIYQIPHCIEYNFRLRICIRCEIGYSLHISGRMCVKLEFCLVHRIQYNIYICIKCQINYYLYNNRCVLIQHCYLQDSTGACAYCFFPYFGYMCENINKTIPDDCELLNRYGNCVRCKNNDIYFWHIFHQRCELRKLSIHCIRKSFISDQCDSFDCDEGYHFNILHYEVYYGVFRSYQAYSCDYIRKDAIQNYQWYWYDYNYYDYGQIMKSVRDIYYYKYHFNLGSFDESPFCIIREKIIEHCIIYDDCYESCIQCAAGFELVQDDNGTTDFYYRYICRVIQISTDTNPVIIPIDQCNKYDPANGRCLNCEIYYTNHYDRCERGTILNCKIYGDFNVCLQCEVNYALFNNQCFYVELCLEYQWIKINLYCTKCIERPDTAISLVQTSSLYRSDCVINLPLDYCAFYVDNICVRCIRGYVLIQGTNRCISQVFVKPKHCLKCNPELICIECIPGYRLVTINGVPFCIKVNGSCAIRKTCDINRCTIDCQGLYIDYQPTCKYQCPELFGIFYGYCVRCSDYFGEGCDRCSNYYVCDNCKDGYFWDQDSRRCKYKCSNGQIVDSIYQCNNCLVANCANCSTPEICTQCSGNLFLQNNRCVEKCDENYHSHVGIPPQVNICFQCPSGCIDCALDAQGSIYCIKCAADLFLDNGKCVDRCTFYALGQNCTNICQYFVLDGQCVDKCPLYFVTKINDDGLIARICIDICDSYFYEDNLLECANGQCRFGYYPNDASPRLCQKCKVENCISCLTGIDQCILCKNGYFLRDGICWYVCPDSLRLVRDPYDCLRCYQRGCTNDCFYDGICTACDENYILENNVCRCPLEKGYTLEYPGRCRPPLPPDCLDPNCISCSPYSYCHQCATGYYLIYKGIENGIEINACVQECPIGFYLSGGVCYPCSANCISCISYEMCRQCAEGYVPVIKYMKPGKSIFAYQYTQMIQCLFKCRDGTLVYSPKQCKCHPACKNCEFGFCLLCNDGFNQTADGGCASNQCDIRRCRQCSAAQICGICEDNYQLDNGLCKYICPDGSLSENNDDGQTCPRYYKCDIPGCIFCPNGPNTCSRCAEGFVYFLGICRRLCDILDPLKDIADQLQICINCPYQCADCDYQGNCTACRGINTLENQCLCPAGYILYRDKCLKKCPFYSENINNQYCLKYCIDGLHPFYTVNRQQRQCEKIDTSENSNFCIQNIENIPDLLTVDMLALEEGASSFRILINIESTPSTCYTYLLRGQGEITINPFIVNEDNDTLTLGADLPLIDQLRNILVCDETTCTIVLEIYFAEAIQYRVNIIINFQLNLIITNGIQYQGSYATFNAVCPTCLIPATLTIASSVVITCPANNICTSTQITTITNSKITIVQTITDPRFFNNKIQPHSLRIVYINSKGESITLFINNYLYDNSILGQISYTFTAIALKSGTLIVTSIVVNANFQNSQTRMLAEGSSSSTFYPQYKIALQVDDEGVASSSNASNTVVVQENVDNSTAIIIGAAIGGAILLLVLGIVIYKIYAKKHRKGRYIRAQSTMSKISELEIAHPAVAATSPKIIEEQNIRLEEKKEIRIPSIAEHL